MDRLRRAFARTRSIDPSFGARVEKATYSTVRATLGCHPSTVSRGATPESLGQPSSPEGAAHPKVYPSAGVVNPTTNNPAISGLPRILGTIRDTIEPIIVILTAWPVIRICGTQHTDPITSLQLPYR